VRGNENGVECELCGEGECERRQNKEWGQEMEAEQGMAGYPCSLNK
jgi:hypothetical protein